MTIWEAQRAPGRGSPRVTDSQERERAPDDHFAASFVGNGVCVLEMYTQEMRAGDGSNPLQAVS